MDVNTARWLRIKRLGRTEIDALHDAERRADAGFRAFQAAVVVGKARGASPLSWREVGEAKLQELEASLGQYWMRSKTNDERATEVRLFERRAYPLWRPAFDRMRTNPDACELALLHEADWAVWNGVEVNFWPAHRAREGAAAGRAGQDAAAGES